MSQSLNSGIYERLGTAARTVDDGETIGIVDDDGSIDFCVLVVPTSGTRDSVV